MVGCTGNACGQSWSIEYIIEEYLKYRMHNIEYAQL